MKIILTALFIFLLTHLSAQSLDETIDYINKKITFFNRNKNMKFENPIQGMIKVINTSNHNKDWNLNYRIIDYKSITFSTKEKINEYTNKNEYIIIFKGKMKYYQNDGTKIENNELYFATEKEEESMRLLKAFKHLQELVKKEKDLFDD
jgi:hypothetical protein